MRKEEFQVRESREKGVLLHDGAPVVPPEGWICVPSGDPGLTRRLKAAGDYWVLVHTRRGRVEAIGLWTDGGTVGIVECTGNSSVAERINGFEESIQNAGFEIKGRINTAPDDEAGLKRELISMLDDEQPPDALMCGDDRMALIVMEALRTSGRSDIIVYSVGGSPAVKSALKETDSALAGIGALSPINMGKTAVKTASALLADGAYEPEIYVETFFIDRENIDMYGTDGWQ